MAFFKIEDRSTVLFCFLIRKGVKAVGGECVADVIADPSRFGLAKRVKSPAFFAASISEIAGQAIRLPISFIILPRLLHEHDYVGITGDKWTVFLGEEVVSRAAGLPFPMQTKNYGCWGTGSVTNNITFFRPQSSDQVSFASTGHSRICGRV